MVWVRGVFLLCFLPFLPTSMCMCLGLGFDYFWSELLEVGVARDVIASATVIIIIITRPHSAFSRPGLEWIVGPYYSKVFFFFFKVSLQASGVQLGRIKHDKQTDRASLQKIISLILFLHCICVMYHRVHPILNLSGWNPSISGPPLVEQVLL